ncbi:hypothetical protein V6N12_069282 [Hibiscus sabdariffa]|uniref:DUF4283 domain-containing protein n=1 Tax=Hibiscus sabdariffa TaxID=183260 RepID=A0ABR2FDK1_9ROSI
MSKLRSVEGVVDSGKMSILSTCAIGWVKKAVSIRALAQEMAEAGLEGFKLMWVTGSMVLLEFPDAETRGRLVLSPSMWSTWFDRLEEWSELMMYESHHHEAELVRVPMVELRDVDIGSEAADLIQRECSVASPGSRASGKGRAVSDGVIGRTIRYTGGTDGLIETVRAGGARGGASSASAVLDATGGDQTRDYDEVAPNQVYDSRQNSNLGILDTGKSDGEPIVWLRDTTLAIEVVVGATGAALVPMVETVPGEFER